MPVKEFALQEGFEFIQLDKLLKLLNLVASGGEAHACIEQGDVLVNKNTELQKRKKLRPGDVVEFAGTTIRIK